MATAVSSRENPVIGSQYQLEIGGHNLGFITEFNGGGIKINAAEHKTIGKSGLQMVQQVPGRAEYTPLKIKRPIDHDMTLWNWRKQCENGDVAGARCNGTLQLLDQAGSVIIEYTFDNCWPSKLSGPTSKSDDNKAQEEEVEIQVEGFRRTV